MSTELYRRLEDWRNYPQAAPYQRCRKIPHIIERAITDEYVDATERELERLRREKAKLRSLLEEWNEPDACGCDTFTCSGVCLAARTRAALEQVKKGQE